VSAVLYYCQIIIEVNKLKRHLWCQKQLVNSEDFGEVKKKSRTYRRVGQPRKLKAKPKHPLKIHIWGARSYAIGYVQGNVYSDPLWRSVKEGATSI